MKRYSAPWDSVTTWSTVIGVAVMLIAGGILIYTGQKSPVAFWFGIILPPALLLWTLATMVTGYEIEGRTLRIRRLVYANRFDLNELDSATAAPNAMKDAGRVAGNTGMFSVWGTWRSAELGTFHAFLTDRNRAVVLKFRNRTIVVSPDDVSGFMEALKP